MRLLRPFLFLLTICFLASSMFAGNSPSPTRTEKPELLQGPAVKIPAAAKQPILITPRDSDTVEMFRHRNFDQGIYAPRNAGGESMCAAIMSYNFTTGENPQLKNVTTCTPARPQGVYRTHDELKHSQPRPLLHFIALPQDTPR